MCARVCMWQKSHQEHANEPTHAHTHPLTHTRACAPTHPPAHTQNKTRNTHLFYRFVEGQILNRELQAKELRKLLALCVCVCVCGGGEGRCERADACILIAVNQGQEKTARA